MTHYAVLIAVTVALTLHMLYFRSLRAGLYFLLFLLPPSLVYDPTKYSFSHGYTFAFSTDEAVPLFNVFAFLFVFYTSWSLAVSLARREGEREVGFASLLTWCLVLTTAMGLGLEFLNRDLHWWEMLDRDNGLAYACAWYWRPALAFPLFLSLLIEDRRLRRRAFKASLIWVWVFVWDLVTLGAVASWWGIASFVFTIAALIHLNRCHRDGRIRLFIPVERLTFDRPRSLLSRRVESRHPGLGGREAR